MDESLKRRGSRNEKRKKAQKVDKHKLDCIE
jgi:hypothetical protein